jgi:1-acyl-sn-glycerol-3-phosphate acyltransferase
MLVLRSLIFNIVYYANLISLMILGLPTILFGRHAVFALARLWAASSLWLLKTICGLRLEFRGLENIPQGGYIIAAKHQSVLETFSLVLRAPDFAYVLKQELIYVPFFGWYLLGAEQIAIDRSAGRNALSVVSARAGKVLKAGRQVFIFPKGRAGRPARRQTTNMASPSSMKTRSRRAFPLRSTPACSGGAADFCAAPASR